MTLGLPNNFAITGGRARARLRPLQLSCPSPLSGFSPCRMNTIVSTVSSLRAAVPVSMSNDNDAPITAATPADRRVTSVFPEIDWRSARTCANEYLPFK